MKHKWLNYLLILLLVPFFLLGATLSLLYLPPVQHWLKKEVMAYVTDNTTLELSVDHLIFSFPVRLLVSGVSLKQNDKLLLKCDSVQSEMALFPLLNGRLKIDNTSFKGLKVNSDSLFSEAYFEGELNTLMLDHQVIDFYQHSYEINKIALDHLKGRYLLLQKRDTEAGTSAFDWKFSLAHLGTKKLSLEFVDCTSATAFATNITSFSLADLNVSPQKRLFSFNHFMLDQTDFEVLQQQEKSFKTAFGLKNLSLDVDSLNLSHESIGLLVSDGECLLSTGHEISQLTAQINSSSLQIADSSFLKVRTPFSSFIARAKGLDLFTMESDAKIVYNLFLAKKDLSKLFADSLIVDMPFNHFIASGRIQGNKNEMNLSKCDFTDDCGTSLSLKGEASHWLDTSKRVVRLDANLNASSDSIWSLVVSRLSNHKFIFPDSLFVKSVLLLKNEIGYLSAELKTLNHGTLRINGNSDLSNQSYSGKLMIDSLNLFSFMPTDSIGIVDGHLSFHGQGFKMMHKSSYFNLNGAINSLNYAESNFSNIALNANLKDGLLGSSVIVNSTPLKMRLSFDYNLLSSYPTGNLLLDIDELRPNAFHFIPPMYSKKIALHCASKFNKDCFQGKFDSNNLSLSFYSDGGVVAWQNYFSLLPSYLTLNALSDSINRNSLIEKMPNLNLDFSAFNDNLLSTYFRGFGLQMDRLSWHLSKNITTPLTSDLSIDGLRYKGYDLTHAGCTLQRDSLSSMLRFIANKSDKKVEQNFNATASINIKEHLSEVSLEYLDANGDVGLSLGALITPFYLKEEKGHGLHVEFKPSNPILAFTQYHFLEDKNSFDYTFNQNFCANIDLIDDNGRGIYVHSLPADSLWSDILEVKVDGVELGDWSKTLVDRSPFSGLFAASVLFKRGGDAVELAGQLSIDDFVYNKSSLGNLLMNLNWSPDNEQRQFITASLFKDNRKVLFADGLFRVNDKVNNQMNLSLEFIHFPLSIANLFIHRDDLSIKGCVDGNLWFKNHFSSPQIDGELLLDSVFLISKRLGAVYSMEQRPLHFKKSKVSFHDFSIYSKSENPFLVNGEIDLSHLFNPRLDLKFRANDYLLLDAKRSAKSLLYGKVLVDIDSSIKGSVDNLKIRGDVAVLGETDLSCVVLNSPLTVKDRLASLVDFKSFDEDSIPSPKVIPELSLGGLDLLMTLNIDPSVRLKVDLSSNAQNYIKLEGGGDLAMRYNPYGSFSLTGRYRFTGGVMRYSLPVIPLKDFNINEGSYIDWTGEVDNPSLNFKATEELHVSVSDHEGNSRMVNFEVSVVIKNELKNMFLAFDLSAPEDNAIQNELAMMGDEERGKQAVALMITGKYLGSGLTKGADNGLNLNMGSALNMVLGSQINALLGKLKDAELTFGVDQYLNQEAGGRNVDYKFRYSQRFFNDRVQIIIGGKVSTGEKNSGDNDHFIDNISLEYRLDRSGSRYIRLFYHNNYESLLQEDITEGGVGIVLRKKMNNLGELFLFKKKKDAE